MPFKLLLNTMLKRLPGAKGAIIADWEGESVDSFGIMDDYDLKVMAAHKGVLLHNIREVQERLGGDDLKEVVITTETMQMIVLPVTKDYYLVLALDKSDLLGKALQEARSCIKGLHKEINQ